MSDSVYSSVPKGYVMLPERELVRLLKACCDMRLATVNVRGAIVASRAMYPAVLRLPQSPPRTISTRRATIRRREGC